MAYDSESVGQRLKAWPGIRKVPSSLAEMFIVPSFLEPADCAALVALIDAARSPSTLANDNGETGFRTSETCHLDHSMPVVAALDARLASLSGIAPAYAEPLQGQRYETGQEFRTHTDFFEPSAPDYDAHCTKAGQRTWTFMIYLNDVHAGGATRFKALGKTFQPRQGNLLAWNNRLPGGALNHATAHHAMKVRKGLKYVITRWYRERPWS